MRSHLFIMLLFISLIIVSGALAEGQPHQSGQCFSIVVGKAVSGDGSIIMAHNEDDYIPQVVNHYKVPRQQHAAGEMITIDNGGASPQVPETWSYIHSEIPGLLFSDSYLNEHGVCICSDACPSREDRPDITDGGITAMLRRIVAERARTSREGVHIAASLVELFGYAAPGRTYIISDPNEGWLFCAVYGKHWVARRVPDDQVAMIANTYTVHEVNLADTMNFLGSADLIDYAVARGWYDPKSGAAFDFAAAYANPQDAIDERNTGRQWDGYRRVAVAAPASEYPLPFAIAPKAKLGVRDIMTVLRGHYEESDLYAADSATGCPHANAITPVCRQDTQTSFVVQLRGGMPADIGLVYWATLASPCASCYIPFYFGTESFPRTYAGLQAPTDSEYSARVGQPFAVDSASAYWTFARLRHTVEQDYTTLAPRVRGLLDPIELDALGRQVSVDQQATELYGQDHAAAVAFQTKFTNDLVSAAMDKIRLLQASE